MFTLVRKFIETVKSKGISGALRALRVYGVSKVLSNPRRYQKLLDKYIKLHNKSYAMISRLVVSLNNGIHPKHAIMNYHQFFVNHVSESDRILDLGCGNGYLTYDVAQKAKYITGIDFDPKHIAFAEKRFSRDNIKYVLGDVADLNFNNKFDKIILSNVLEHIKERVKLLASLARLSDTVLLRVPMITRDWLVVYKKQMGYEYRLDHTHETEYTLEALESELVQSGWCLAEYQVNWGELWGVLKRA